MQLIYLTINRVCKMQQSSNRNFDENNVKQIINNLSTILRDNETFIQEACDVSFSNIVQMKKALEKLQNEENITTQSLNTMLMAFARKKSGKLQYDKNKKLILISRPNSSKEETLQIFDKYLQSLQEYCENEKGKEQVEKQKLGTKIQKELEAKIANVLPIQQFIISPNLSFDKGFSKSSGQMKTGIQISNGKEVLYYGKAVVKGIYEMFCYKLLAELGYAPELYFICVPSYQMFNGAIAIPDKFYGKQNYIVLLTKKCGKCRCYSSSGIAKHTY